MFIQFRLLVLTLILIVISSISYASQDQPGPSLRIYVYDQQGRPLHGAVVNIKDNWNWATNPKGSLREAKADGSVLFPHTDFVGWCIYSGTRGGKTYKRRNPWNWEVFPSMITGSRSGKITPGKSNKQIKEFPERKGEYHETEYSRATRALFKVRIDVSMDGFESNTRIVDFSKPKQEVALRLNRKGAERSIHITTDEGMLPSNIGRGYSPQVQPITNLITKSDTAQFSLGKKAKMNLYWPNGLRAVSASVGSSGLVRPETPNGYGLWLRMYVFNNQGNGNFFHGSNTILLGRPRDGSERLKEGKTYRLDCGDISIEYELNPFTFNSPSKPGWSGNFQGQIRVTAYMQVIQEQPPMLTVEEDKVPKSKSPNFCSQCGTKQTPNAKYCSNCGNKVVASSYVNSGFIKTEKKSIKENIREAVKSRLKSLIFTNTKRFDSFEVLDDRLILDNIEYFYDNIIGIRVAGGNPCEYKIYDINGQCGSSVLVKNSEPTPIEIWLEFRNKPQTAANQAQNFNPYETYWLQKGKLLTFATVLRIEELIYCISYLAEETDDETALSKIIGSSETLVTSQNHALKLIKEVPRRKVVGDFREINTEYMIYIEFDKEPRKIFFKTLGFVGQNAQEGEDFYHVFGSKGYCFLRNPSAFGFLVLETLNNARALQNSIEYLRDH